LNDIASGQKVSYDLKFYLLDKEDQVIATDSESILEFKIGENG